MDALSQGRARSLEVELAAVRRELAEAQANLQALKHGEADAILVETSAGPRVFTLRSADEPYRVFVENLKEGALTITAEGDIVYCNDAFARMVARTCPELVGTSLTAFAAEAAVADLSSSSGVAGMELRLRRQDGKTLEVRISSTPYSAESRTVWCLLVTDLTGQSLRLRHNAIVEATDDAVLSFDLTGRITSWNRGAEALFGYSPEEAIGRPSTLLVDPDDETRHLQVPSGPPDEYSLASSRGEMRCRAKNGEMLEVAVTESQILEPDGRVAAMCAIIRDIREQKRSEARLRESEERFRVSFANASIGFNRSTPKLVPPLTLAEDALPST